MRPEITGQSAAQSYPRGMIDAPDSTGPLTLRPLPGWVSAEAPPGDAPLADAHFRAGAVFLALDGLVRAAPAFLGAFRQRLALEAAIAGARLLRTGTDAEALRDALHLTRTGEEPGLASRLHRLLMRAVETPTRLASRTLDALPDRAGADEMRALLMADVAQAERLGWPALLPLHLLAAHDPALKRGDEGKRLRLLEAGGQAMRPVALARAGLAAHRLALDLGSRADRLTEAAGRLRTREAEAGLALILGADCVAPWRMAEAMGSDRAARRFCESLAAKGALRLLTPRATFRLYGL